VATHNMRQLLFPLGRPSRQSHPTHPIVRFDAYIACSTSRPRLFRVLNLVQHVLECSSRERDLFELVGICRGAPAHDKTFS
jgi:hypothetical protein